MLPGNMGTNQLIGPYILGVAGNRSDTGPGTWIIRLYMGVAACFFLCFIRPIQSLNVFRCDVLVLPVDFHLCCFAAVLSFRAVESSESNTQQFNPYRGRKNFQFRSYQVYCLMFFELRFFGGWISAKGNWNWTAGYRERRSSNYVQSKLFC